MMRGWTIKKSHHAGGQLRADKGGARRGALVVLQKALTVAISGLDGDVIWGVLSSRVSAEAGAMDPGGAR